MDNPITRRTAIIAGLGSACGATLLRGQDQPAAAKNEKPRSAKEILEKARNAYSDGVAKIQAEYRKALAEAIQKSDRVQVCLLDFVPGGEAKDVVLDSNERFPILPYQQVSKILKHSILKPEDLKEVQKVMAATLSEGDPSGGAWCHFPIHGVRFYMGDSLIYFTSLCWHCGNFYVSFPENPNGGQWVGLPDDKLEELMKKILPIPESEIQRFEKQFK